MRCSLPVLLLAAVLFAAAPAQAQLRAELPGSPAPVAIYEQPTAGFQLGSFLNAETFKVSHSYEFSYANGGGEGLGLGVYTTSLRFQPSDRLAARVDLGVAHSPFGSSSMQERLGFDQNTPAQVYLRNATLAYRPTDNSVITFSVQQSPFGGYASPYGYGAYGMSPFGGTAFRAHYAPADHDALFWRTTR